MEIEQNYKKYTIEDLWKYNVSTVLVFPIFDKCLIKHKIKYKKLLPIGFIQICFSYGLVNTYLTKSKGENILITKFDREQINKPIEHTNVKKFSLLNLIMNIKEFCNMKITNDYIFLHLRIPTSYNEDIELIRKSQYSKLSTAYKEELNLSNHLKVVHPLGNIGDFITTSNIGYAIAIKKTTIKQSLEKVLVHKVDDNNELYIQFNEQKETINYGIV